MELVIMKHELLELLACPRCHGELRLEHEQCEQGEIVSGDLVCASCSSMYRVENGIPRFLLGTQLRRTQRGFSEQWRLRRRGVFEGRDLTYGVPVAAFVDLCVLGRCDGNHLADGWALDVGCGTAEKAALLAQRRPDMEVVAIDMNHVLDRIAADFEAIPNLHFVQGDVMAMPFKRGSFRLVYSIGVLHCTQDTRQAFFSAARFVERGGNLVVWLYPDEAEAWDFLRKNYWVRDVLLRNRGHFLPSAIRLWISRGLARLLLPWFLADPGLEPYFPAERDQRIRSLAFYLYDTITPEYQFRHAKAEALGWYQDAGFAPADGAGGWFWGTLARPA
jgi:uncharacterized protein YbaR (Trm112 family)